MRRLAIGLFLVLASSLMAASVLLWLQGEPTPAPQRRTMDWLAAELSLTREQTARVRSLHEQLCPSIARLSDACGPAGETRACAEATERLIERVCAELTPEQRAEYLKLVAACRRQAAESP